MRKPFESGKTWRDKTGVLSTSKDNIGCHNSNHLVFFYEKCVWHLQHSAQKLYGMDAELAERADQKMRPLIEAMCKWIFETTQLPGIPPLTHTHTHTPV